MKLDKNWEVVKRFRHDYTPEEQSEKKVKFTWKTEVKNVKTGETKTVDGKVKVVKEEVKNETAN